MKKAVARTTAPNIFYNRDKMSEMLVLHYNVGICSGRTHQNNWQQHYAITSIEPASTKNALCVNEQFENCKFICCNPVEVIKTEGAPPELSAECFSPTNH